MRAVLPRQEEELSLVEVELQVVRSCPGADDVCVTVIGETEVITEPKDLVYRENKRGPNTELEGRRRQQSMVWTRSQST